MEEDNTQSFLEASQSAELDKGHDEDRIKSTKKQSSGYQIQTSLEQEISQFEERLKHQVGTRHSLERTLGYKSSCHDNVSDVLMPMPATELIKEISVLELEVVHLEKYLLSLYRKAFNPQVSTSSTPPRDEKFKSPLTVPRARCLQFPKSDIMQSRDTSNACATRHSLSNLLNEGDDEKLVDSVIQRCHSSISQCSVSATKAPQAETLGKALRACHSQPLSMMENTSSKVISLAEHLGTHIPDHIPETPNKISEDMIKCMSSIYYKFADPPLSSLRLSSPNSSFSSMSVFSPKDKSDMWSPGSQKDSSFDVSLDKALHVEGLKEFNGPYSTTVEVPCIYTDDQKLDVEDMLLNFRSLIGRLEQVNPRKMTHEEKLAFWINIHNAVVMHAFLAYGFPQNNMKRLFLLMKAAYNVGGHLVSADMIQNSILGCRMSRSVQWLWLLITSKSKFKNEYEREAYSINRPQPLLHFALCTGSRSDPVIRVFTPKRVLQELEMAKDEYIRATFGVKGDKKLLLSKTGLCPHGFTEMILQCFPESVRKSLKNIQTTKSGKSITWIPYNFSFRYHISKEVVK